MAIFFYNSKLYSFLKWKQGSTTQKQAKNRLCGPGNKNINMSSEALSITFPSEVYHGITSSSEVCHGITSPSEVCYGITSPSEVYHRITTPIEVYHGITKCTSALPLLVKCTSASPLLVKCTLALPLLVKCTTASLTFLLSFASSVKHPWLTTDLTQMYLRGVS